MSHDHHMMGHAGHEMPVASVDATATETTTHDHGSMTTQHAHQMMGMNMQVFNI